MLGWAALDRSIWALVGGALFGSLIRTILSHSHLPGISNRWHWDRSAVREIANFGKWIVIASILGYLANNGDRMLLGGMIGATALGTYAIAFFIFKSVDDIVVSVIMNVTLPALSETVRENPNALKVTYYRFHAIISSFAYFCAGCLDDFRAGAYRVNLRPALLPSRVDVANSGYCSFGYSVRRCRTMFRCDWSTQIYFSN